MDVLGVNYKVMKNNKRSSSQGNCRRRTGGINNNYKKDIKVVYISSPMMVKTSASKFRDLVQELTGKDSDAATRFMDDYDHAAADDHQNSTSFVEVAADHGIRAVHDHHHHHLTSSPSMVPNLMDSYSYEDISPPSSSTCSDSTFEPFDGLLEGGFMGMLQSNLFFDASQLDVFN